MAPPDSQPTTSTSAPFSIGERIERRYVLESLLHAEPASSLFAARDLERQRAVILQCLALGPNPLAQVSLSRSIEALTALAHPNIAAITDHGPLPAGGAGERGFVVYEWLEGESLQERMARGRIPSDAALTVVRQLLAALASMHAVGLVHGGVRPLCLFLQRRKHGLERTRLQGFRFSQLDATVFARADSRYDAPELARGHRADPRSDVYAVGVLLAELWPELAARPARNVALLRVASFETVMEAMIACATEAQPEERFSNAAEMLCNLIDALPTAPARPADGARESTRPPPPSAAEPARAPAVVPRREPTPIEAISLLSADAAEARRAPSAAIESDTRPLPRVRRSVPAPTASVLPLMAARPPARGLRPPTAAIMLGFFGLAVLAVAVMESDRLHSAAKPASKASKAPAVALSVETETDVRAASDRRDGWHSLPSVAASTPSAPDAPSEAELPAQAEPASARALTATSQQAPPPSAASRKRVVRRMDARDPWLQPVPSALQGLPAFVRSGAPGSEAMLTALRDYNYKNPGDARGFLLLGRLYCNRLWRTDCVNEWSSALRRDPSARGALDLLPTLLQLVAQGKAADPASDLIALAYGREALPAIEQALPALRNSEPAARLRALATRIDAEE